MYDQKFWNERYAVHDYLYGTEANTFLVENADLLCGRVLSLSEGEGRNAVFMAFRGLNVFGVDCSEIGLRKAQSLAKSRGVVIETEVADLAEFQPKENYYGSVVSISAHLPSFIRNRLYPLIERALKPGVIVLLEAYSENQLAKNTGDPKNIDMLMTVENFNRNLNTWSLFLPEKLSAKLARGKAI